MGPIVLNHFRLKICEESGFSMHFEDEEKLKATKLNLATFRPFLRQSSLTVYSVEDMRPIFFRPVCNTACVRGYETYEMHAATRHE